MKFTVSDFAVFKPLHLTVISLFLQLLHFSLLSAHLTQAGPAESHISTFDSESSNQLIHHAIMAHQLLASSGASTDDELKLFSNNSESLARTREKILSKRSVPGTRSFLEKDYRKEKDGKEEDNTWLDMGAYSSFGGSFGWYVDHPVGGGESVKLHSKQAGKFGRKNSHQHQPTIVHL